MKSGPIFDKDPRKRIAKVVKASGVKWKRNALRHSFGSYRMEQTKNEGQVALEMGNSPKIVKDHYFEIVDERAAREYWNIKPLPRGDRKNVIPMLMETPEKAALRRAVPLTSEPLSEFLKRETRRAR
jgi:hypothetical protein